MSVPEMMRVVDLTEYGPPESMVIGTRPTPHVGPGEVLVAVAAAGVNRADVMQRCGNYPPPTGVSDILGLEVSGTIAAVGSEVTNWTIGQSVCALVAGGGYAEYCVAPAP